MSPELKRLRDTSTGLQRFRTGPARSSLRAGPGFGKLHLRPVGLYPRLVTIRYCLAVASALRHTIKAWLTDSSLLVSCEFDPIRSREPYQR